jgi:enoyl-CoA hydratase/carnithine racemase
MSEQDLARHETEGRVSYVTLNRPGKLNAIDDALRLAAMAALEAADANDATRVVVLRGAGRAFCVGYDIGKTDRAADDWRHDPLAWRDYLHECLAFEMKPFEMRKPVIASVQGYALGGGCELAMFCDLTICADDARFGEPEIRFSDAGPGLIMPFIVGHKRARELLYMGDMIDAATALECGMVNRVVPAAELEERTRGYANRLALIDPEALLGTKLALRRGMEATGLRTALQAGVDVVAPMYAARTESGMRFEQLTREQGLVAALRWRRSQFDPS